MAVVLDELAECIAGANDTEAAYLAEELQKTINRFVTALPETEGNVFIRRYFLRILSERYPKDI